MLETNRNFDIMIKLSNTNNMYLQTAPNLALSKCLYFEHFSINFPTQDSSDPFGIFQLK